jgi:hypothetical protein
LSLVSLLFSHSFSLVHAAGLEEGLGVDEVFTSHVGVLLTVGVFEELVVFSLLLLLGGTVTFFNGAQISLHFTVL